MSVRRTRLIASSLVVVVSLALVATLLIVSTHRANGPAPQVRATDASVLTQLSSVSPSVFNQIGVSGGATGLSPLRGAELRSNGKPDVVYVGAEFCPFCAAERWALVVALARFGTWHGLSSTESSTHPGEVFPGTPTFTFHGASYTSAYLNLTAVEAYSATWDPTTGFYTPLMKPSALVSALVAKYDTSTYLKSLSANETGALPFLDIANRWGSSGASFSPGLLDGLSHQAIAHQVSTGTGTAGRAIVSAANYITAGLCTVTGGAPAAVCSSAGVRGAAQ